MVSPALRMRLNQIFGPQSIELVQILTHENTAAPEPAPPAPEPVVAVEEDDEDDAE